MIEGQASGGKSPKLRYGMIGGGQGAFIGDVHRKSIAMDGKAEIVCGAFSQSYDNTLATGDSLGLPKERLYRTFDGDDPGRGPAARPAGLHQRRHAEQHPLPRRENGPRARLFRRLREAAGHELRATPRTWPASSARPGSSSASPTPIRATRSSSTSATSSHAGEIGDIRFVNGEYPQEWLVTKLEDTGQKQAAWRTDPKLAGISNCVGDIGSHIEFMAAYMTGLEIEALCARLDRFGPGRPLDDNATIMVNYKGGAKGVYWSSQIAAGHDNALRLRIYGTKGAVEWFQETPNTARVSFLDRPSGTISRGRDPMWPRAQSLSRLPSGHPEGYFESFANVYATFITALGEEAPRRAARRRRPRLSQRRRRRPRRPLHREMRRELGQGRDLAEDGDMTGSRPPLRRRRWLDP